MTDSQALKPAAQLVKKNAAHDPNESKAYRQARDALMAEEIELRRHIVRVAEQRRALPPGGEVSKDYRFDGESAAKLVAHHFARCAAAVRSPTARPSSPTAAGTRMLAASASMRV